MMHLHTDDSGLFDAMRQDTAITAIHISHESVRYDINGRTIDNALNYLATGQKRQIINGLVAYVVASIIRTGGNPPSASNPVTDWVLDDGTHVHATYQPLSITLKKTE